MADAEEDDRPGDLAPMSDADLMVFEALWSGVVNDWEASERHDKFLDHARTAGGILEAAKRYGALKEDEARGPFAKKRLEVIATVATAQLFAMQSAPAKQRTPPWVLALGVAVCLTLLGISSYWACGFAR